MLPVKWKRFRMITYLHMAITALICFSFTK